MSEVMRQLPLFDAQHRNAEKGFDFGEVNLYGMYNHPASEPLCWEAEYYWIWLLDRALKDNLMMPEVQLHLQGMRFRGWVKGFKGQNIGVPNILYTRADGGGHGYKLGYLYRDESGKRRQHYFQKATSTPSGLKVIGKNNTGILVTRGLADKRAYIGGTKLSRQVKHDLQLLGINGERLDNVLVQQADWYAASR